MRQVDTIKMGVYSPTKKPFFGFPKSFKVWNVRHAYAPDFRGEAFTTSLNGNDRANIMGYRDTMTVDLNNSYGSQVGAIRSMFNLLASNVERTFWPEFGQTEPIATGGISGQDVTIEAVGVPLDFFENLFLRNYTQNEIARIKSNTTGLNPVVTLVDEADISTWQDGDAVAVVIPIGIPRLIGASTDDDAANISYYNLTDGLYGISRELTIGNQLIRLDLRGIGRRNNIPNKMTI